MELMCMNKKFECIGTLNYINLQWNRRYYEVGDFSAQIRAQDYDPNVKYLYTQDRPEIGIVEKVRTEEDITGRYIQLSGRFLESMLAYKIIFPRWLAGNGKLAPTMVAFRAIRDYAQPELNTEPPFVQTLNWGETLYTDGRLFMHEDEAVTASAGEEVYEGEFCGETVEEAVYTLLKPVEKSVRIVHGTDDAGDLFTVQFWQGKDRTQSQTENSYALFSDESGNTEKITIDEDTSDYRNYAYILLDSDDNTYITCDARTSEEPKRAVFIDESGASPEKGQSQKAFRASLIQKAKEELAQRASIVNVEAQTIQNGLLYLRDYDLGDKCDIVSNMMQRSYESRIIEVREVFKDGQHEVEIVFGDKIPTIYERMMHR